jgi:hypothetical protein
LKQLFRKAVGFDATEADSPEENNALDRTGHEGHSPASAPPKFPLNSCTYIYEPNRRVLSSGGYRELARWVFAYVALVGMLCRAPRADHFKATTRSP